MRVIATRDLWNDGKDRLLVLSGTAGTVIERHKADEFSPGLSTVAFDDGNSTYCTADEICEYDTRILGK